MSSIALLNLCIFAGLWGMSRLWIKRLVNVVWTAISGDWGDEHGSWCANIGTVHWCYSHLIKSHIVMYGYQLSEIDIFYAKHDHSNLIHSYTSAFRLWLEIFSGSNWHYDIRGTLRSNLQLEIFVSLPNPDNSVPLRSNCKEIYFWEEKYKSNQFPIVNPPLIRSEQKNPTRTEPSGTSKWRKIFSLMPSSLPIQLIIN